MVDDKHCSHSDFQKILAGIWIEHWSIVGARGARTEAQSGRQSQMSVRGEQLLEDAVTNFSFGVGQKLDRYSCARLPARHQHGVITHRLCMSPTVMIDF